MENVIVSAEEAINGPVKKEKLLEKFTQIYNRTSDLPSTVPFRRHSPSAKFKIKKAMYTARIEKMQEKTRFKMDQFFVKIYNLNQKVIEYNAKIKAKEVSIKQIEKDREIEKNKANKFIKNQLKYIEDEKVNLEKQLRTKEESAVNKKLKDVAKLQATKMKEIRKIKEKADKEKTKIERENKKQTLITAYRNKFRREDGTRMPIEEAGRLFDFTEKGTIRQPKGMAFKKLSQDELEQLPTYKRKAYNLFRVKLKKYKQHMRAKRGRPNEREEFKNRLERENELVYGDEEIGLDRLFTSKKEKRRKVRADPNRYQYITRKGSLVRQDMNANLNNLLNSVKRTN